MSDDLILEITLEIISDLQKNTNSNIYIYPEYTVSKNNKIITPKKINQYNKLKKSIREKITITETYFRNLIKIETSNGNVTYAIKKTIGKCVEDSSQIIIINTYTEISENNFPNTSGHHMCTKKIHVYNYDYDLINIVSHNDILLIEIKNIDQINLIYLTSDDRPNTEFYKQLKTEINSAIEELFS